MREIELCNRKREVVAVALVDDQDYERVAANRWCRNAAGYAVRYNGIYMHREVLGLVTGDGLQVDHINRNKLDNRRANLRLVTHAKNGQNLGSRKGTSKYRGVHFCARTQRWHATVMLNRKLHYIGAFRDEDVAGTKAAAWRLANMPAAVD